MDGAALTLTYDEALDETSRPATDDFTVKVADEDRRVTGVDVSGAAVTLTLVSAVETADAVTVAYDKPPTGPVIQDAAGNAAEAIDPAVTADNPIVPKVKSIALTSDPGADKSYAAGETIDVTVTFDAPVTLAPADARSLALTLDIGGRETPAVYRSGSGTTALELRTRALLSAHVDDNGVSIGARTRSRCSRGRRSRAPGAPARTSRTTPRTSPATRSTPARGRGVKDVRIVSTPRTGGAYEAGEAIDVAVEFTKVVRMDHDDAYAGALRPGLALRVGAAERRAVMRSDSDLARCPNDARATMEGEPGARHAVPRAHLPLRWCGRRTPAG